MKNLHCLPKRIIIKRAGSQGACDEDEVEVEAEDAQICGQTKQRPIISPSFDLWPEAD